MMKYMIQFSAIFLIMIIVSCTRSIPEIVETDMSILLPDSSGAMTVKESQKRSRDFGNQIIENTVGKKIPEIPVYDSIGNIVSLKQLLCGPAIIIAADQYCSFGKDGITNDFPKAIKQLEDELSGIQIIVFLKLEVEDIKNPERYASFLKELQSIYPVVYTIKMKDAYRINLIANPARLYVDDQQIVQAMGFGISRIPGRMVDEIRENIVKIKD